MQSLNLPPESPGEPTNDQSESPERYASLGAGVLRQVAEFIDTIESLEEKFAGEVSQNGLPVWLKGPIAVHSDGHRLGFIRSLDDFWYFHPDPQDEY